MASAAMALQEQHGSPTSDKISLESNTNDEGVQSKEQFNTGDDCALKARKPYTISKQRERWTEEEHTRFLEALKLYGRAWKKIEEHVGTKTAVQIRSHAQKFFSKIVRESNNGDATDAKAIEIPPPRPKRKPMRPYPRKQAKTGILKPEKLIRSESQDSSTSEQENQSPVSVLSANSSDISVQGDSCTPNGSLSPVSSAPALNSCSNFGSDLPKMMMSDDAMDTRSQPGNTDENPNPDEEVPLKLELLSENYDLVREDQSGVQCLKLFGKTFLVKNHSEDACSPVPLPWLSLSTQGLHSSIPIKAQPCEKKQKLDNNKQMEISSSTSNSNLSGERSWDVDSLPSLVEKQPEAAFNFSKLSNRSLDNSEDHKRGFVPYKRRLLEQNSGFSSTVTDEERPKRVCCL